MATKTKAKALTARVIDGLASDPAARREVPDGATAGLYVVVQPSGTKSFAVRYRHGGKPRKMTIGPWPETGLADARRAAERALEAVAAGRDPAAEHVEAKRAAKAEAEADPDRDLVRGVVAKFLEKHASKRRTGDEMRRSLAKEVLPVWGARRMDEITRRDVRDLIEGVVARGAPVQANRVLALVRKLFAWAVSQDYVSDSPVRGVEKPTPENPRDRILTDAEIAAFWRATGGLGYPFGPLFRLLLLTGARLSEVSNMTRDEITGDEWLIPARRAKNGKAHPLPLSSAALDVLATLPASGFMFTTTGVRPVSGFTKAKDRLDAAMLKALRDDSDDEAAKLAPFVLHDLRRTCASGMARLGIPVPVCERVLNHVSGSFGGVAGVYNGHSYADEMRRALEAWGDFVLTLTGERERAANVVKLTA
jgi:integrase